VRGGALIGMMLAILGVAVVAAPTDARGAKTPRVLCAAKNAPDCGTVLVHVYGVGGPHPGGQHPQEGHALHIAKLGPRGEVLGSVTTGRHRVSLLPGRYDVAVNTSATPPRGESATVTLSAGQTQEVTLTIPEK
jgi:hypothetical protein